MRGIAWCRRHAVLAWAGTVLLVASPAATPTVEAAAAHPRGAVKPCSNGLVALTFDDGPSRTVTSDLLDVLHSRRVPATFFVVGERVAAAPRVVRRMHALGFKIGNHTYRHEQLTSLSAAGIEATLRRTRRVVTNSGAAMSNLMRPPYGLIDARVRAVVGDMGLTPVLWTVDPRDWENIGSAVIADRVIRGLRPDGTNVVLLHDGIGNSRNTLRAVPDIIRRARSRGYCFAELGATGRPVPPVPVVRVANARVFERTGEEARLRFHVTLSRPTSRPTSIMVTTSDRSAVAGEDYAAVARRVRFPVGTTRRTVSVRVFGDARDERRERLVLKASEPRGLKILDGMAAGTVRDDDAPPRVALHDVTEVEPAVGSVLVDVPITLDAPSGRWVVIVVETQPGTAGVDDYVGTQKSVGFAPGEVARVVRIELLADDLPEGPEQFSVVVASTRHARIQDGSATVTIDAPP